MPPWSRASSLERALACPASTALPRDDRPPGEGALWGTAVHHWKATGEAFDGLRERGRGNGRKPRLEVLSEAGLSREVLWPGGVHEVTYVVRPDGTVERCLTEIDKDALPRAATAGTLDWENPDAPTLWVDDLKTGRFPQDRPSELPQLLFYAMAAAEWHRAPSVLLSLTHWPRYPRDRPPTRVTEVVPADRLRRFKEDLLEARDTALQPDAHELTRQGPWCMFCPCRNYCPEFVNE